MKKLVLTGAAGRLGSYLREPLSAMCDDFVSSDILEAPASLLANETYVQADLANLDAMVELLEGADMVVHFGAIGDEAPFETLLGPNFIGAYNIWEAAHRNNLRRVVYASSIHAVGMHKKTDFIGIDAPHKESVCMRILSCAQVSNSRAVGTWLSYDDLIQLVRRAIDTPITGFSIVYGVSDNDRAPVDNAKAHHLGYKLAVVVLPH